MVNLNVREEVYGLRDWMKIFTPNPAKIEFNRKQYPAILLCAGGTTGLPKGVRLTHYNLCFKIGKYFLAFQF